MTCTSQEVKQLLWSEVENPNKILTLFRRVGGGDGRKQRYLKQEHATMPPG